MLSRLACAVVLWGMALGSAPAFDNTYLIEDAGNGDREAQYTLAHLYLKGKGGIVYDVEEAIRLLERSALNGHQMAAFDLARLYLEGISVQKDSGAALRWFTLSAELGQVEAQYFLGRAYQTSDMDQAVRWLKRATEGGHQGAAAELEKLCSRKTAACTAAD